MHAADEKPVLIFNTLIGINNNRIECYRFAAKETGAITFQVLFSRLIETSLACNEALITEVYKLGGVPYRATLATTGFFTCWHSVHAALKSSDSRRLIEACSHAENIVLETYAEKISENEGVLNTFQLNALRGQFEMLSADAGRVNNLCHIFSNAA